MESYKVTTEVIDLVKSLVEAGYEGEASLCWGYPSGAAAVLGESWSIQLTGFCKESIYITGCPVSGFVVVGRYDRETAGADITADDLVLLAWRKYKRYKERGYGLPSEFKSLFVKRGYLKEEVKTVKRWIEV